MEQYSELITGQPIIVSILLFAAGLLVGLFLARRYRFRKLESALRHTELERNDLHVQAQSLRELVDNQELDIQRYVAELQELMQTNEEVIRQKQKLEQELASAGSKQDTELDPKPIQTQSSEANELMIKMLRNNIARLTGENESLQSKLEATKPLYNMLRDMQEEQKILKQAIAELENALAVSKQVH